MIRRRSVAVITSLTALAVSVGAQSPNSRPVLYVVGTSHLDSQWNWTVQDSIRTFVPTTFFDNFALFERFPHYTFSYEGAIHYMWFKEYHPEAWATLQKYVAAGRWQIAGNWINAVDVNVPSPESLMRHALLARRFFRREFQSQPGRVSARLFRLRLCAAVDCGSLRPDGLHHSETDLGLVGADSVSAWPLARRRWQ